MNSSKLRSGHPLSADEAADELLKNWPIPDVTISQAKLAGRSTAFGMPLERVYHKPEETFPEDEAESPEELDFPKLTMEELEQIRQDAFDEGLKQGHEQGYLEGFDKGAKEGHEAGFAEGREEGKVQGLEDAKPLVEEKLQVLRALIDGLETPLKQVNEACEKELVQLAVMLAEAVIYQEVKLQPDVILHTLRQSLDALPGGARGCQIFLHPDDLALVRDSYGADLIEQRGWHLMAEPSLERGGCQVRSERSSIDMTLKQRVKETLESFLHDSGI